MSLLKKLFLSFIISLLVALMVTAAFEDMIFFSAFLGIPAGIITFIVVFAYMNSKDMDEHS